MPSWTVPLLLSLPFFFQAEDGIRDTSVTGVQTCALPILHGGPGLNVPARGDRAFGVAAVPEGTRSEERRVGKECRSRWWPDDEKKKKRDNGQSSTWEYARGDGVANGRFYDMR